MCVYLYNAFIPRINLFISCSFCRTILVYVGYYKGKADSKISDAVAVLGAVCHRISCL